VSRHGLPSAPPVKIAKSAFGEPTVAIVNNNIDTNIVHLHDVLMM
jgi:hypothetical protein